MTRSSGRLLSIPIYVTLLVWATPRLVHAQQNAQTPNPAAQTSVAPTQASPSAVPSSASAPTQAQVTAPPASPAPLPNRLNEILPSWLRVRGEFRERIEGFDGFGFTENRDDLYYLSRLRLNVTATATSTLSFQAQVQDARVAQKEIGPTTAPFRGPFDLRLGFADIGNAKTPVLVRVGRQEMSFGEQRLVGALPWTNTARSWDGARLTVRTKAFQIDTFGTSLVRSLPGEFDKSGNGNRFAGAYATTTRLIPLASVEPFVFWKRDVNLRSELGPLGSLKETTTGVRVAGKLPARLDYGVELAKQTGSLGPDSVDAWAGHWQIRESLPGRLAFKLTSEYNHASGDSNARDGSRGTFDQLYPTGHDKLGLSDQVGWRNVHHIREGIEFSPFRATPISVNYHSWWLDQRSDGLYAASGALIARVAGGAASTHVGQELDVLVSRALTPQLQLAAGYAHIFTGAFLRQATPGASYSQPYVMVTYVFLAEK